MKALPAILYVLFFIVLGLAPVTAKCLADPRPNLDVPEEPIYKDKKRWEETE